MDELTGTEIEAASEGPIDGKDVARNTVAKLGQDLLPCADRDERGTDSANSSLGPGISAASRLGRCESDQATRILCASGVYRRTSSFRVFWALPSSFFFRDLGFANQHVNVAPVSTRSLRPLSLLQTTKWRPMILRDLFLCLALRVWAWPANRLARSCIQFKWAGCPMGRGQDLYGKLAT